MKFKSALVTQISGSIGGLTGSHNKGGMYFRARSIPINANTEYQQEVRNLMSQVTAAWRDVLTPVQRQAWMDYASGSPLLDALGEERRISGLSHYVRSNVARMQAGLARVDAGPTNMGLPTMTPPVITTDVSDSDIDIAFTNSDAWATAVGGAMLVKMSAPQSLSINYWKGPYRYQGLIEGAVVPPTSPATLEPTLTLVAGLQNFFEVRVCLADGRLSSPFRYVATAAA